MRRFAPGHCGGPRTAPCSTCHTLGLGAAEVVSAALPNRLPGRRRPSSPRACHPDSAQLGPGPADGRCAPGTTHPCEAQRPDAPWRPRSPLYLLPPEPGASIRRPPDRPQISVKCQTTTGTRDVKLRRFFPLQEKKKNKNVEILGKTESRRPTAATGQVTDTPSRRARPCTPWEGGGSVTVQRGKGLPPPLRSPHRHRPEEEAGPAAAGSRPEPSVCTTGKRFLSLRSPGP